MRVQLRKNLSRITIINTYRYNSKIAVTALNITSKYTSRKASGRTLASGWCHEPTTHSCHLPESEKSSECCPYASPITLFPFFLIHSHNQQFSTVMNPSHSKLTTFPHWYVRYVLLRGAGRFESRVCKFLVVRGKPLEVYGSKRAKIYTFAYFQGL